jgi:penicillin-binding protein 1C
MSDQTNNRWFIPNDPPPNQPSNGEQVPMPGNTEPPRTGQWYVPPDAVRPPAASASPQPVSSQASEPEETAEQPVQASQQAPQQAPQPAQVEKPRSNWDLPEGAAISTEADYSNYVPGVGFVKPGEGEQETPTGGVVTGEVTMNPATASANVPATNAQPVAPTPEPPAQPAQSAQPSPSFDEPGQVIVAGVAGSAPVTAMSQPAAPQAAPQSNNPSNIPSNIPIDTTGFVGGPGAGIVTGTTGASPAVPPQTTGQAPAQPQTGSQPAAQVNQQPAPQAAGAAPANAAQASAPQPANVSSAVEASAPGATAGDPTPLGATGQLQTDPRFKNVESEVKRLRRRYFAGGLTRDQLQAELRRLMFTDDQGFYWMIGLESDRWYKYNGKDWTPADPPMVPVPPSASAQNNVPSVPAAPTATVAPGTGASAAIVPAGTSAVVDAGNRFDIPLDEYGMPLPKQVPLEDLGATMVGKAASRLDSQINVTAPNKGFDGGKTMVSTPSGVTVQQRANLLQTQPRTPAPGQSAFGGAVGGATVPAPVPGAAAVSAAGTPGAPRVYTQPDYGPKPGGAAVNRQHTAGCLIRAAFIGVFIFLIGSVLALFGSVMFYFSTVNRYTENIEALASNVRAQTQSVQIFDAANNELFRLDDPNTGQRTEIPLSQVSPEVIFALIATENERFYTDPGFDIIAITRAVFQSATGTGIGGASTITQQLARMQVLEAGAAQDISAGRKINEILVSSEIARRYTKSQILEFYLNSVYFGNRAYGIEAAAQTYFQKSARDLNLAEAALLVGLIQAPGAYDPANDANAAIGRAKTVQRLMLQAEDCIQMEHEPYNNAPFCVTQQTLDQSALIWAQMEAKIATFVPQPQDIRYPHFVYYVRSILENQIVGAEALYNGGLNVYTTIDPRIQDVAQQAVLNQTVQLARNNVTNGSVLVIRPSDGAILAMVGSADFFNEDIDGQVNGVLAARQPGSAIKPFVYAASMEQNNGNYMTAATVLWDVPTDFGGYVPVNYSGTFSGPQSMRVSLAQSLNIPAVKALQFVGIERFKNFAERLGLSFPLTQPEQAGLPMALGGVEVRLFDMTQGYAVLANGGRLVEPYGVSRITRRNAQGEEELVWEAAPPQPSQVLEPAIAYLLSSILSDNASRAPAFGANSPLNVPGTAVKTGTTNDYKDNWTIGYSPDFVVGVWVGNFNGDAMRGTTGLTGAAPIWNETIRAALAITPSAGFTQPQDVTRADICRDFGTVLFTGCINPGQEFFWVNDPPPPADAIYRQQTVDTFSGLIANQYCPDFTETRVFLNISDPTGVAWINNTPQGNQWALQRGITPPVQAPPTAACDPNTPRPVLNIVSPAPNQTVSGLVQIQGQVQIPNFNRYQIEVAQGFNATQGFRLVDGPIQAQPSQPGSFLGRWDTSAFPPGEYTMRLFAVDAEGRNASVSINVFLNNAVATPTTDPFAFPTTDPNANPFPTTDPNIFPTTDPNTGGNPFPTTDPFAPPAGGTGGQPGDPNNPIVIDPFAPTPTPTEMSIFPPPGQ